MLLFSYKGSSHIGIGASLVAQPVKNLPASAGDARDPGSIPGLGRFLEKETATSSSILAWKIPRTEEPGGQHHISPLLSHLH